MLCIMLRVLHLLSLYPYNYSRAMYTIGYLCFIGGKIERLSNFHKVTEAEQGFTPSLTQEIVFLVSTLH